MCLISVQHRPCTVCNRIWIGLALSLLMGVGVTVVALLCGILGSRIIRACHMHCQESEGYLGPRPSWPQPVADSMAKADSDAVCWASGRVRVCVGVNAKGECWCQCQG